LEFVDLRERALFEAATMGIVDNAYDREPIFMLAARIETFEAFADGIFAGPITA
jgi:hypothetical protein